MTYVRQGPVVVLKSSAATPLRYGGTTYREARWVVGVDVFDKLCKQNPATTFVEQVPGASTGTKRKAVKKR